MFAKRLLEEVYQFSGQDFEQRPFGKLRRDCEMPMVTGIGGLETA